MDIEINDLDKYGSIRDKEGYQLQPEAFTLADSMRFTKEGVEKLGGRSQVFGTPTVAPHFLLPIQTPSQNFWIYTSLTKAYVYDGSTHTNITRALGDYTASNTREWNGVVFGGIPILNNGTDDPQYWALPLSVGTPLIKLANWPASTKAKIIRSIGSFLVALDVTKTGTRYPHMVKWSHPADPGTVPTSWDETDPSLDAGEKDLPDVNAGIIQDALPLKGQLFIYKGNSVWRMRFIGGQFIFGFDTLLESAGLLAPRCVTLTGDGQKHLFATQDDIMIHDGTKAESFLDERWRKTLIDAIDPVTYINSFMFTDPYRSECWFCYPERGQTNPNRALIMNTRNGDISESSCNFRNAASGVIETSDTTTWGTVVGTWDSQTTPWSVNSRRKVVVCATDVTKLLQLDDGIQIDSMDFTGTLQRVGLGIVGRKRTGEWIVDFTKHKLVTRVWIKGSGGPISVRVGFQATPDGTVSWLAAKPFNPATQKFVDFAGSGKAVAVEFSSTKFFRIAGYKPEITVLGRF